MTRDHDLKRAIRKRMKATGERYTVARAAVVAPDPPAPSSGTSRSRGGTMAIALTDLLGELDEQGYAILRACITGDELAHLVALGDDVLTTRLAANQAEEDRRRAEGETGWVNVWHPGPPGVVSQLVTDRPEIAWIRNHEGLLEIESQATGAPATFRNVGVGFSLPGYGHQGFHADNGQPSQPIGEWTGLSFVITLTAPEKDSGGMRVIPGSHRTRPQPCEGWAMATHPDEVRTVTQPGDVLIHCSSLWKSNTFNGGTRPRGHVWV